MKHLFFAVALLLSFNASANESSRKLKIEQIIEATGLHKMFQQQLDQSKIDAPIQGQKMFDQILADSGLTDTKKRAELEVIFKKFVEQLGSTFTAKELTETWILFYGKTLSEPELDAVLAFYLSPIGQKDVAASQNALTEFSKIMSTESAKRSNDIISNFLNELRLAMRKQ